MDYDPVLHGTLADWIGIIVTTLTVFLTIRHYSNDNKVRFQVQATNKVVSKKDSLTSVGSGLTLTFYNTGKVPTAVRFEGMVVSYTLSERIIRWILPKFFRFSSKARKIYNEVAHDVHVIDLTFMENIDYELMHPFAKPYTISISHSELMDMTIRLSKGNERQKRKLKENKKITFQFVYLFSSGKEAYMGIAIYPSNPDYQNIKEKVLPKI